MITLTLVIIAWEDASYSDDQQTADEINPYFELISCGFLVKEDDKYLTIATELDKNPDDNWKYIHSIPKYNIKSRQDITINVTVSQLEE